MVNILDVFLHLDVHLQAVIGAYGVWTYVILFVVIFLGTGLVVTPFLPGDSLLFAAGTFAASESLEVGWLFGLLFVAAVLGDETHSSCVSLRGAHALQAPCAYPGPGGECTPQSDE